MGKELLVRAPNHLGDLVMALGALREVGGDVVVVSSLTPILEMAGISARILPFRRGAAGWFELMEGIRSRGYRKGILLSGSFSAALLFRAAGIRELRGMAFDGRRWLLTDPLPGELIQGHHRVNNLRMVAGLPPLDPLRPHPITPPEKARDRWRGELGGGEGIVALFPGSNASARRWDPDHFGQVGAALLREGRRVVVLGGPGERALTARVAAGAPGAHDLGGKTDLAGLAAILSLSNLLVTNDTGPMHLAAAVGTPTVTLWGSSDPTEVHPLGARDARVQSPSIPCAPCKRNECPRTGPGTLLPEARNECMHLIRVESVLERVRELVG